VWETEDELDPPDPLHRARKPAAEPDYDHPLLCRFLDAGKNQALGTLSCQASKKRQGTKSREVGPRLGSERYGDLMSATTLMVGATLLGSDRDVWTGEVGRLQWPSRQALGGHQWGSAH
jgi:hypothetical protein